jgi:hypothetical protein
LDLQFGVNLAAEVRINATYPLIDRIANGDVTTDGSEAELAITYEEGIPAVGPRIHRDDHHHVFENLAAALEGKAPVPLSGSVYRIRWHSPQT